MLSWRLDGFRTKNKPELEMVIKSLRQALGQRRGWITLSGPYGTGKTFLLAAMANEARLAGVPAMYITMAELLQDLRDSFHPEGGKGFSGTLDMVLRAQVLCLDEIEKFNATQWAEETFFRMVEERYRNWDQHLTVLATNRRIGLDKQVVEGTRFPGYLESRIMDGRFWQLDQFWRLPDARPGLR